MTEPDEALPHIGGATPSPPGPSPAGRRAARPRDALGRPLPFGVDGVAPLPDDVALPPREALARAQELLDTGLYFHAHEVLEAVWKAAPQDERELWRGLTQLIVGLTHLARGNPRGALALLQRGTRRLEPYLAATEPTLQPVQVDLHAIDLPGLLGWARRLTIKLAASGRPEPAPPRLTLR